VFNAISLYALLSLKPFFPFVSYANKACGLFLPLYLRVGAIFAARCTFYHREDLCSLAATAPYIIHLFKLHSNSVLLVSYRIKCVDCSLISEANADSNLNLEDFEIITRISSEN